MPASSIAVRGLLAALLLALLAVAACCAAAGLDGVGEGPELRIKRLHVDFVVNADGSYTELTELVEQLNSARAVEQAGQIRVPYSASLDEFEILEANTIKSDGRRLRVSASSIFTQDGLISPEGLTSFQDLKTTVVIFPSLEPGDSIAIRSRLTRRRPVLPGVFSYTRTFAGEVRNDDATITLTAPTSLALMVENPGLSVTQSDLPNGQRKWTWKYANDHVEWPEEGAVDAVVYRPHLMVSSLRSYDELAAVAGRQFAGKASVTAAVRAQAAKIVGTAREPAVQARRIVDWVAHNIRYFSIVLDVGGFIPRTADEVLSSRFGDCKDHAIVVQALLAAQGIDSRPALLSTMALFELPRVPVLSAFNHAIVYLPGLDLFVDTNTTSIALGALPQVDADKPVLLLGSGSGRAPARTPPMTAETNRSTLVSQITIAADGSASGQDVLTAGGSAGVAYGSWADALSGTDPVRVARSLLLESGLAGDGTAAARRLSGEADFRFELLYELRDYALPDQGGGVRPIPPLDLLGPAARASVSSASSRTLPFLCSARTDSEVIELRFPPNLRLSLPRGLAASGPDLSYQSSYSLLDGNRVRIERRLVSTAPHGVCQPGDFPRMRAFSVQVLRDLRSEVRFSVGAADPAAR